MRDIALSHNAEKKRLLMLPMKLNKLLHTEKIKIQKLAERIFP